MIAFLTTAKMTAQLSAIAMGSIMFGEVENVFLSPGTPISLGSAIAVGAVVVGGAWWLSSMLQKINDRLSVIEEAIRKPVKER